MARNASSHTQESRSPTVAQGGEPASINPLVDFYNAVSLRHFVPVGAFGVPTFVVDGRTFWGNDRLVLVRHHLGK